MAKRKSETQKAVEKAVKKTHKGTLLAVVLALIIGAVGGFVVAKMLTKNDKFELKGDKEIVLSIGDPFVEPGITVISFGKDISDQVVRVGDFDSLDTNVEGVYQIVYKVDDFRWGKYQLVRTVTVGTPSAEASIAADGRN